MFLWIKSFFSSLKRTYLRRTLFKLLRKNAIIFKSCYPVLNDYNIILNKNFDVIIPMISLPDENKNDFFLNRFFFGHWNEHMLIIGTTGNGNTRSLNTFDNEQNIKNDYEHHSVFKLINTENLLIDVYYKINEMVIIVDSKNYNYNGVIKFERNKIAYFENSHNHSFHIFKENIMTLALCNPSTNDFLEVFEQNIPFEEKIIIYKMLEI